MVDRATIEPFPTAAFVSFWIGFGIIFWTSIGMVTAGVFGLAFGTAAVVLTKGSQWVFDPIETTAAEKQRFLRRTAISQVAFTSLLIPVAAYLVPRLTSFIFPATWVLREPAILYYMGGVAIVCGIALFTSARKFA